ncbi:MAG: HlyD family efflux transporter periplasmic adaptor subunit [Prevotellaceae bacterium]|jgi:HlyD family secretion protein|nr:HlyD family efflux transporter periplasmic adaptor subunit [Prevotellaceae bacterium]
MKYKLLTISLLAALVSCGNGKFQHDASGTFEATEVIVSAMATGQVKELDVVEGQKLVAGQELGYIDTIQLYLQKRQLQAGVKSINAQKPNVNQQVAALKEQIRKAETERQRVANLLTDNAATPKQLDDVEAQLLVLKSSLTAAENQLNTAIGGLSGEGDVRELQILQIDDLLTKSHIISPIAGTVLSKYVQRYEVVAPGVPLLKLADTKNMFLRAYIVSTQLDKIKVGQAATVFANNTAASHKKSQYKGTVAWISDKAEFTPKTIQTHDERQNLVYAVKIAVENTDGLLKIGMYGDVIFDK